MPLLFSPIESDDATLQKSSRALIPSSTRKTDKVYPTDGVTLAIVTDLQTVDDSYSSNMTMLNTPLLASQIESDDTSLSTVFKPSSKRVTPSTTIRTDTRTSADSVTSAITTNFKSYEDNFSTTMTRLNSPSGKSTDETLYKLHCDVASKLGNLMEVMTFFE